MSDRYSSLTVVLDKDVREDDVNVTMLMNAIQQLRGVISVCGNVVNIGDFVAYERARSELKKKIYEVLQ